MNRVAEHLTIEQLRAYRNANLPLAERCKISRHLLQCKDCIEALPAPTPAQFLAALFDERERFDVEPTTIQQNKSEIFGGYLKIPSLLLWSGGAFAAVLLGLTFWVLLGGAFDSPSVRVEIAKSPVAEVNSLIPGAKDEREGLPQSFPSVEPENEPPVQNSNPEKPHQKPKTTINQRSENDSARKMVQTNSSRKNEIKLPDNPKKVVIAVSRGTANSVPCAKDAITTEITADKNKIVLKWKEMPKATKYHLYVSDDEEILIDEFETDKETFYVLKKPLDSRKTYKWRVIVTLENGSLITNKAQKFTLKDLRSNRKKSQQKEKSGIRCLENE